MKIAVIVPTRGRPANAQRLISAFEETVTRHDETQLIFGVDEDDPLKDDYLASSEDVIVGPRLRMAGTLNAIAREICNDYDIIGFMGDDHMPRTIGWDDMVRLRMEPGGIIYGNDLIQGEALPTEVFLDAKIVRTLDCFVPDGFIHLFLDNTWKLWGEKTGKLTYIDNMIIEHLHPLVGTAETDAGYVEVNSRAIWQADQKRFNEYINGEELQFDLELLRSIT